MKKYLISALKFLLFLSIGLGILYYAYYTQNEAYQLAEAKKAGCAALGQAIEACTLTAEDFTEAELSKYVLMRKLKRDFASLNYLWVFASIGLFMISNVSRAIQWNMLLKPLGRNVSLANSFMAVMIGYMANSVIPRAGELVRCGFLSRYEKLPVNKVLGTVAMSRSLDVLMLALAIGLMLALEGDLVWGFIEEKAFAGKSEGGMLSNPWVLTFLGLMLAGGITFLVFRKRLLQIPIIARIWAIALGFWEGLKTIGQLEKPFLFVFHTVVIWVMYFLMHYVVFFAFEPVAHLPPVVGLTVFVFGSLGIVIPAPGGIGAFQYLVTNALIIYGIAGDDAFSFSNVIFFPIFFSNIIVGAISVGLFPYFNRGRELEEAA